MDFLRFLAQHRSAGCDIFFQGITYLAQEIFVIAVICWFYWCRNKKLAYCLGLSYFSSGFLVQGLKITFRIPRPWILDVSFQAVPSALPDATGYSFPSGHTQSITALFGTGILYCHRKLYKFSCGAIIALVMFSRMYLGCHTPKDVLVSFIISLICVLLNYYFIYRSNCSTRKEFHLTLIMIIACIFLTSYAVILNNSGIIDVSYARDCIKASGAGLAFSLGYYIEAKHINFRLPVSTGKALIRFISGLLVALFIQIGLKPVIGQSLIASFVRYFIVVLWIVLIYPAIFNHFSSHSE